MTEELIPWDKLHEVVAKYPYRKTYIRISVDLLDFFIDTAKATDDHEMIGFLLGRFKDFEDYALVQLYDYIQCKNVAEDTTSTALPAAECVDEICSLINKGRYDILTRIHTHPSDSLFSLKDLFADFRDPYVFEYRTMYKRHRYEKVPQFIVTGGETGYVIAFTNRPFLVMFASDEKYRYLDSELFRERRDLVFNVYSARVDKLLKELHEAHRKFLEERKDEFYKYLYNLRYGLIKIPELESIKPEPRLNPYKSSLRKSTKEEIVREILEELNLE
ncbi:MAG: hypothetical protein N2V75_00700 [Methanophagales archaeon]|nr:hypothetical protein [Methanophagales archaeon]